MITIAPHGIGVSDPVDLDLPGAIGSGVSLFLPQDVEPHITSAGVANSYVAQVIRLAR